MFVVVGEKDELFEMVRVSGVWSSVVARIAAAREPESTSSAAAAFIGEYMRRALASPHLLTLLVEPPTGHATGILARLLPVRARNAGVPARA